MIGEAIIDQREKQHYLAIRAQVTMAEMGSGIIPQYIDEIMDWMDRNGVDPDGPPLLRYHTIDMNDKLDIAIGWPVEDAMLGNERIELGVLPAGRYASLVYTGVSNGIAGNKALLDWIAARGLQVDRWDDPRGDAFGGRVEYLLDGPEDDPNPANWDTEVAMLLADT